MFLKKSQNWICWNHYFETQEDQFGQSEWELPTSQVQVSQKNQKSKDFIITRRTTEEKKEIVEWSENIFTKAVLGVFMYMISHEKSSSQITFVWSFEDNI